MDKKKTEILFDIVEDNDGYVSVSLARDFGVFQTYLCALEEQGFFTKVSKGLYVRKGYPRDIFYELSFRYHKAVFALPSALYLHHLAEEEVLQVNLPTNYLTSGIEGIKCRHVGEKEYRLGQSLVVTPRGNLVNSYDLERTLIDLLRARNNYEKEVFLSLWDKGMKKVPYRERLHSYAQAFHVEGELELLEYLY